MSDQEITPEELSKEISLHEDMIVESVYMEGKIVAFQEMIEIFTKYKGVITNAHKKEFKKMIENGLDTINTRKQKNKFKKAMAEAVQNLKDDDPVKQIVTDYLNP